MHRVGVLGATGATGGELLRLLSSHPDTEVAWVSSRRHENVPVPRVHPHLSSQHHLTFERPASLDDHDPLDVLFCATPHGTTGSQADRLAQQAEVVIDLSSDFRLNDPDTYEATYGDPHSAPERLAQAAYGLPELDRSRLARADWIAGPGCLATAAQLALHPLLKADLLEEGPIVLDGKIGSTAGGASSGRWGSHPARTATVRPYAPTGHRHEAEIRQNLFAGEGPPLWFSAHAVDMPRGVLMTVHVPASVDQRTLHRAFLEAYTAEPFVDVLPGRAQPGSVPEPRFVVGTNRAQVAGCVREDNDGAVLLCALDNLGKGAAGSAVQSMNLRLDLDEVRGLQAEAPFP